MDSFRRSTPEKVPQGLRAWNNIIFHADDERKPSCNTFNCLALSLPKPLIFSTVRTSHLSKPSVHCPLFPLPHFHWLYIPLASSPTTHTVHAGHMRRGFPPLQPQEEPPQTNILRRITSALEETTIQARYLNSTALPFLCHKILQHSFKNLCLGQHMGQEQSP